MIDKLVEFYFIKHLHFFVFFWLIIAMFVTTILPLLVRETVIPGIKKRYILKDNFGLDSILNRAHRYPTVHLCRYVAYQLLGLSKRIDITPGGMYEWLVEIGYDVKQASFYEKFICVFSFLFNYLLFLIIIIGGAILIYYFFSHVTSL